MKKWVLLCWMIAPCAWAEEAAPLPAASLFFSGDEVRTAEALAQKTAPGGVADIRLGAVMYYAPADWVLWLQGERWTPQTVHEDVRIIDVTPEHVRLTWHGDDSQPDRDIVLRPNETYQIATGKTVTEP